MFKFILLVIIFSQYSFSWDTVFYPTYPPRDNFIDIERLSSEVQRLTHQYSRDLTIFERRRVYRLLRETRDILLFPDRASRACSMQDPQDLRVAFSLIKQLAYSSTGLGMSKTEALSFTQNWIENYSCSEAEDFSNYVKQMRLFSCARTGLAMSKADSIKYTITMALKFCGGDSFDNDFREWLSFASSANGMNLPEDEARTYAKLKMENRHFSCQI